MEFIIHLGDQCFTGIFPKNPDVPLASAPLELVKCSRCGLVQLHHNFAPAMLYGPTYGYRSGLNKSMVEHLRAKATSLQKLCPLHPGDIVLDIGSNDGTSLGFYPDHSRRLGMDSSAEKLANTSRSGVDLIVDFFSGQEFPESGLGSKKAKIVSSIAMFYDLASPPTFVEQIRDVLAPDGIWHLEQSYLPLMLKANAYDTICHEHLEYYALKQIKRLTDKFKLEVRAKGWVAEHGPEFPGDAETGLLGDSKLDQERFEDFANEAACPALDPATGRCDVYEWRPMTCRAFWPAGARGRRQGDGSLRVVLYRCRSSRGFGLRNDDSARS